MLFRLPPTLLEKRIGSAIAIDTIGEGVFLHGWSLRRLADYCGHFPVNWRPLKPHLHSDASRRDGPGAQSWASRPTSGDSHTWVPGLPYGEGSSLPARVIPDQARNLSLTPRRIKQLDRKLAGLRLGTSKQEAQETKAKTNNIRFVKKR